MKAVGLFAALVAAHVAMLAGKGVMLSPWAPIAYFWQDALLALCFAAFDRLVRKPAIVWPAYAALVAYAALNAAVARILPTPLTPSMLRAVRGPLIDSMLEYVTVANVGVCLVIVAVAVCVPVIASRLRAERVSRILPGVAVLLVAAGPYAAGQLHTRGAERNALAYLLPASLPFGGRAESAVDFRASPFDAVAGTDLSKLEGRAAGRNVVFIVLESVGAEYLRTYGARKDPMPNLTRLAQKAIVFESAYAVYPESIKGLYSVICSRYPALGTSAEADARRGCPSLARLLSEAGYRTALFHSGRFDYLGMRSVLDATGFDVRADAGDIGGRTNSSFGIDEPSTVDGMLEWIDGLGAGERFFVAYLPIAGHHPYATFEPGPFDPIDESSRYLNAIHEADAALGRLLDGLRKRGLSQRTLFVVYGDHGEAFGQHEGNIGHSFFLYEENLRVPFIIAAPGLIEPQRTRGAVSLLDTAPTVLELLGLSVPTRFEGRSSLGPDRPMALFFTDYANRLIGLRDGCWKMHYDIDTRQSLLYDLCSDPAETVDLAAREPERVKAYVERLEGWIVSTEEAIPSSPRAAP